MRLTSAMWFAVFMRMEVARGAYVCVIKSGAQEAGALFIVQNHLDGTLSLYGPAPQMFFDEKQHSERFFECVLTKTLSEEVDEYLEKQKNFDPDLWIIETESGNGEVSLSLVSSD